MNNADNDSCDGVINDLEDKLRLDGDLSKLKFSIGACDVHCSQNMDGESIGTEPTESSTDMLHNEYEV